MISPKKMTEPFRCYYSKWAKPQSVAEKNWIGNFGEGMYMGVGGKSAIIDLSGTEGPSRLGTYFGNGSSDSGYKGYS